MQDARFIFSLMATHPRGSLSCAFFLLTALETLTSKYSVQVAMPTHDDSITWRNEDLLRLQRKLRERKSARIELKELDGIISSFTNPYRLLFLFESDAMKNIQQIFDEILYTLEQEREALTSHRARAEPERRFQLRSRTNDQIGRMTGELRAEIIRHRASWLSARWTYFCVYCHHPFATRVMQRGHEDLVHKKISAYGIKPDS